MSSIPKSKKVFTSGDPANNIILPFKNQDYNQIKADCLRRGVLFEDPEFPATDTSIYYSKPVPSSIEWRRPQDIVGYDQTPVFFHNGTDPNDLDQGAIGDCWFISACAALVLQPELFPKVVPPNQECSGPDYAGVFHFRFWQYGQWYDVVIDDRLPVSNMNGQLIFVSNREEPNEFWAALLEKAYAKACLAYENLIGGDSADAFKDFSGGIVETFDLKFMQNSTQKERIWNIIIKARKHESLVGASIFANPRIHEAQLSNGLVMGHAYTITKVAALEIRGKEVRLIRVRNPWGNEFEWRGAWSDNSREWSSVSSDIKQRLGHNNMPDGQYWMSYDDFYKNFDRLQFGELSADAYSDELLRNTPSKSETSILTWKLTSYHDAWVPGESSGGSGYEDIEAYWTNPQFLITLTNPDYGETDNLATIIISLMQKFNCERRMANNGNYAEEPLQFRLYKVINQSDADKVKQNSVRLYGNQLEEIGTSGKYINCRDVTKRFRVPLGNYLIIPSNYLPNTNIQFLLRIFTEEQVQSSDTGVLFRHKYKLEPYDLMLAKPQRTSLINNSLFLTNNPVESPIEKHGVVQAKRRNTKTVREGCNTM